MIKLLDCCKEDTHSYTSKITENSKRKFLLQIEYVKITKMPLLGLEANKSEI